MPVVEMHFLQLGRFPASGQVSVAHFHIQRSPKSFRLGLSKGFLKFGDKKYMGRCGFAETKAVTCGCLHIQPPSCLGLYEQDFIPITGIIFNFILLFNIAWTKD